MKTQTIRIEMTSSHHHFKWRRKQQRRKKKLNKNENTRTVHEHRLRNDIMTPGTEVHRDADLLTENEIPNSGTVTTIARTSTAALLPLATVFAFYLKTSSASLTANLMLSILLVSSYTLM